jgi:signal transduction histidine kinase
MSKKMRINWLNKIFSSIFMKLLMILLITGICINLLVGGFFMYIYRGTTKNTPYRKNIVQYVHYLINDLGSPPDVHRAQKISRELSVDISYESPDLSWSTSKTIPPVHQMRLKKFHEDPHVLRGKYRGKYFIIVQQEQGQGQFTFAVARAYRQETGWEIKVVFLIGLLTLVLGGVYLTIRWILRPVKWLNEGVQHVSGGNLDYRLPVKKSDELGKLAEAFNTMTARIREMLHSKEQLLMDVSHELRSPLTRMKVALEFLPETQAKRNLGEDVSEMEKMVSEILETARLQTEHGHLNLQRINMAELIREMTGIYTNKPPGIEAEDMPENVVLDVDRERIKTVLKNILDNAVKYSDSNSVPVKVSLKQKEAYVIVHITDSGKGIPPEDLPYIFEPFYRVDKSRARHTGGYGLGLSLCKTIMEVHQGKIEVDSSPDNGTIVSLFFPAPQAVSSDEHH